MDPLIYGVDEVHKYAPLPDAEYHPDTTGAVPQCGVNNDKGIGKKYTSITYDGGSQTIYNNKFSIASSTVDGVIVPIFGSNKSEKLLIEPI